MSKFLAGSGVECTILTTDVSFDSSLFEKLKGVKFVVLPSIFDRFYIPKWSYTILQDLITSVDIIHLMGHWNILNVLVYYFARRYKKPYVICPAGELAIYGRSAFIKRIFNGIVGKRIVGYANGHVAIAVNEIPSFIDYAIEAKSITVIPNGVAVEDYMFIDDSGFRKKHGIGINPLILFMGRLNHIKGPDLLLHAFHNVKDKKDYHLVFVGPDGGMLEELKNMVAQFDIGNQVHFIGYLGGEEKSHAYNACELLVIPSRQEAMSIVVLEAGCTGTPVLATDQCGLDVIDSIGGGLVVPATVEGIQTGIEELLGNSDRLELMGHKLKDFVEEYLWSSIVHKYIDLYNQILGE